METGLKKYAVTVDAKNGLPSETVTVMAERKGLATGRAVTQNLFKNKLMGRLLTVDVCERLFLFEDKTGRM